MTTALPARLKLIAVLVAAIGINVATGLIGVAPAAHAQAKESVRPELAKPLQAAQDAIRAQKFKEALNRLQAVDAIGGKTPFETYMVDRTRGAAAMGAGENELAGRSFESALNSGRMNAGDQAKVVQALISLYYRAQDYPKAIVWMQRAIKDGTADNETRALLVQSYYLSGDLPRAQKELQNDMAAADRAGRAPTESQLQLMANLASKSNDKAAYVATMERLVANYPTKAYWADLLSRVQGKPGFADRLVLDLDRLKLALGQLSTTADYMEMSQLALQAGFPAEGKKIVELGFSKGVLGTGAEAARHKRLQDLANKNAAEDLKAMAANEAEAQKDKDGTALVNLGYDLVTAGQTDKGIALMQAGITRGGLKRPDDARLHLGLAYLQAGKKAEAIKAFKTVQGTDGAADLARYWIILTNRPMA
ncbi:MAG: tetratricopeptide repeat protein [Herminiimonas sp.]|nr:tetratricopeptide repeat protein [Herminiimonas sp.]